MITEKDMEYIISANPDKYIEEGLVFLSRQLSIGSYRFDLLFKDRHGAKLIVELQKGTLDRNHTYKIFDYFNEFKEQKPAEFVDVMIIANKIPRERQRRLKSYGVPFIEIDETTFTKAEILFAHWEQFFDKNNIAYARPTIKDDPPQYSPSYFLSELSCWIDIYSNKPDQKELLLPLKFCLNSHEKVHVFVGEPENSFSFISYYFYEHFLPLERVREMINDPIEYATDTFSEDGLVSKGSDIYFSFENKTVKLRQKL